MKKILLLISLIAIFSCKDKLDNWIVYKDSYNIASISLPKSPSKTVDTAVTPNYKIVYAMHLAALKDKKKGPSAFGYDIYFPTNIEEFDLFQMKKDSAVLNKLFENIINGVLKKTNAELLDRLNFQYPEPGVRITIINKDTKTKGVCRIIIFDNYLIATSATGTEDDFSNEMEEEFFKTLKINPENRSRK